ncbi:MAG: hypothetical protein J1G06_02555 [Oscillospiraceae bacterium]|nr:hypothetical protein [Oscillospiraceae bacterium]
MKKYAISVIGILIIILLLACNINNILSHAFQSRISHVIGVNIRKGTEITHTDSHGGFHGDGTTFVAVSFSDDTVLKKISKNRNWKAMPLTDNLTALKDLLDKTKADIPEVRNGYYYFINRQARHAKRHDDSDVLGRYSYNFTLAIYDADTNILYYTELDT